jgi:hypothetical protein
MIIFFPLLSGIEASSLVEKSQRNNRKDHFRFFPIELTTKIIHRPITQFKSNYRLP